jgi:adenylate cyclase
MSSVPVRQRTRGTRPGTKPKPAPSGETSAPVTQNERAQLQEMALLLGIARQVAAIETLDELLHTIVDITSREIGADRGSLFLNDEQNSELYSRVAQGLQQREIRIPNNRGIVGHVFTSGKSAIVAHPYKDPHFDEAVDRETGYLTKNILATPILTPKGETIGVLQMLNKKRGRFSKTDLRRLEAMAEQTALTLRNTQLRERMHSAREQEMRLLDVVSDVTAEFDLSTMLTKIVGEAAKMLRADRATLFLNDHKTNELFSRVAMGGVVDEIRLPNTAGIAGAVFTSGKTINIPYAYADLRFNPAFDRRTGYFTRSILCVPLTDRSGNIIGVTQVLNKRGGPFTADDEARLKAFTAQVAISLQSAKLFDDVQNMKNYSESMLQSMSNGVVTLDEDGRIVTCNLAGLGILRASPDQLRNQPVQTFFAGPNQWILDRIKAVEETLLPDATMDAELAVGGQMVSVNLNVLPLMSEAAEGKRKKLGTLLMIDDISTEKRMKSTMSRYMDPALADRLLAGGEEVLGGKSVLATVLFSDIRNFTGFAEELGPQSTVRLLNEYFTIMVDCIQKQGGMLDKFIGDAVMAVFGLPVRREDDDDRAARAAIAMVSSLQRLNAERTGAGKKPLEIGIGLNTDTVVSGNIGSPKRMDYTIIGDGVNLAARLESACKQYFASILISENTYHRLVGTYRIREVDLVVVKGKQQPVAIYEILDYHTEETFPNLMESVNYFKGALSHYRNQQWDKALAAFRTAAELNPKDRLPQIYIGRCEELKATPPPDDWNGVWVLKTK